VSADAFERPGVSTAQLATLIPGNQVETCAAPRDVVLYPEPVSRPRRVPSNGDAP
jgi:hypothetical protein